MKYLTVLVESKYSPVGEYNEFNMKVCGHSVAFGAILKGAFKELYFI